MEYRNTNGEREAGASNGTFEVLRRSAACEGRVGRLRTLHGEIETPAFMPVGTQATVKGMTPEELKAMGADVLLCNMYHLHLRPGEDVIAELGGLHRFMNWDGPILTDSGGFQVFSLSSLRKITEDGIRFRSHLNGDECFLSPEGAVRIQQDLGADIIMCLDECIPHHATPSYVKESTDRTSRWAVRCRDARGDDSGSLLFGIVQGGMDADLRKKSAEDLLEIGFDGYALGGLSVGESAQERLAVSKAALGHLPEDKPRYLMGVGAPEDLVTFPFMGVDLFDCVIPTRCARNGLLFTKKGKLDVRHAEHARSDLPPDESCGCYTCRNYSRAYLRHLYMSKEILAARLNTLHNLHFYMDLMREVRSAIEEDRVEEFRASFFENGDYKIENSSAEG